MASITNDDKGFFWNSQGGDRKYNAESFGKWLSAFFTTGVLTGDCDVTAQGNNMKVIVAPGYVNINNPDAANPGGKVRLFESDTELTVEMADNINPRIDTVVVERNDNNREVVLKVVKGTAAADPVAKAPVRNGSVYQLVLAEIYVAAGVTTISNSNITMKRADPTVCGIITGAVTNNQILYGTTDLIAGTSELPDGTIYFVYV